MTSLLLLASLVAAPATLTFDDGKADQPPAGFAFTTGDKAPAAKWVLKKDGKGLVLAQVEDKIDKRFACAVVNDSSFKNVRVGTRLKTLSGYQAAGVVWGWKDANNYFVARTNPEEGNIRADRVVNGVRQKIGGKPVDGLKTGAWHALQVEHRGKSLTLSLGGKKVVEVADAPEPDTGRVGLWAKDDTVAHFDDFLAEDAK